MRNDAVAGTTGLLRLGFQGDPIPERATTRVRHHCTVAVRPDHHRLTAQVVELRPGQWAVLHGMVVAGVVDDVLDFSHQPLFVSAEACGVIPNQVLGDVLGGTARSPRTTRGPRRQRRT